MEFNKKVQSQVSRCALIIGFALCCAIAIPTAAQIVLLSGIGTSSCGKWLDAKASPVARAAYRNWVLGFVSGANWYTPGSQAKFPDAEAAVAFMDNYCENNPLHIVGFGASALVQEAGGPKAGHEWKK